MKLHTFIGLVLHANSLKLLWLKPWNITHLLVLVPSYGRIHNLSSNNFLFRSLIIMLAWFQCSKSRTEFVVYLWLDKGPGFTYRKSTSTRIQREPSEKWTTEEICRCNKSYTRLKEVRYKTVLTFYFITVFSMKKKALVWQ